ncbi:MAG: hypothetical protein LBE21_03400, partial [Pseudomonadales bacterium]|nr:hypothetical protein [Pseudomonadales bacterium]
MKTFYLAFGFAITSLTTGIALADTENAQLSVEDGVYLLKVPLANIPGKPGAFQEGLFEAADPANPQDWRLVYVEEGTALSSW